MILINWRTKNKENFGSDFVGGVMNEINAEPRVISLLELPFPRVMLVAARVYGG